MQKQDLTLEFIDYIAMFLIAKQAIHQAVDQPGISS